MRKSSDNIVPLNAVKGGLYKINEERETNIVGQRISELRKAAGFSLATFSSYLKDFDIDVGPAAISKWERGTAVPNAYQFMAVCFALGVTDVLTEFAPSQDRKQLLNAEGQRKVAEYTEDLIASGKYTAKPVMRPQIEYIPMRFSELPVSAGTGAWLSDENIRTMTFPKEIVPDGADLALRVSGNSMEPVYHDGQIVWVEECEELRVGDVGIFVYDECGYMKKYEEREPDPKNREAFTDSYGVVHAQPVLISYNDTYDPIYVSPEAGFQIVGRVIG